jgi:type IV pilus assembly protein PilW
MKGKQKHSSLSRSNQGFTLIELMVAMVVSLLALAAIYSTFQSQHQSYQLQRETADMQQNIRTAMYYMQREIRMVGNDPLKLGPFGFTNAGNNTMTFTEDVRGDIAGATTQIQNSPDGDVGDPDENITYSFIDSDADGIPDSIARTDNNAAPPVVPQIVARNIDALDFVYLNGNSAVIPFVGTTIPAANRSQIRFVQITIVAHTKDQLMYVTSNNRTYLNQRNLPVFNAPGDNRSRRILTATINCRALSLED